MADYNLVQVEELSPLSKISPTGLFVIADLVDGEYVSHSVTIREFLNEVNTLNVNAYGLEEIIPTLRDLNLDIDVISNQAQINLLYAAAIEKVHDEANIQADWNQNDSSQISYIENKPFVPQQLTELVDVYANRADDGQILVIRDRDWETF